MMVKKHSVLFKFFFVFLIVTAIVAAAIFRVEENRLLISNWIKGGVHPIRGELSLISVTPKVPAHTDAFLCGQNLVLWQENKVIFLTKDNEVLNEREVIFENPKIVPGKGRCVIFGKGEKEIFIFNERGNRTHIIKTSNPVEAVKDLGDYIGVIEREEFSEFLEFFYPDGTLLFSKKRRVGHFGNFSYDRKSGRVCYITFSYLDGKITSKIHFVDLSGKEIEDSLLLDELIIDAAFRKDAYVYALKDNLFFSNNTSKKLFGEVLTTKGEIGGGEILSISIGDTVGILTKDRFIETDFNGNLLLNISHSMGEGKIEKFDKGFLVSGKSGFFIVENGKLMLEEKVDISECITNGRLILLFSEEGARWNDLKYVPE